MQRAAMKNIMGIKRPTGYNRAQSRRATQHKILWRLITRNKVSEYK